jgi:hypothetical protein
MAWSAWQPDGKPSPALDALKNNYSYLQMKKLPFFAGF